MKKMKMLLIFAAIFAAFGGAFFVGTKMVEAHTRTVKIRVDKNGFSPSTIQVEEGHKLNLVFRRADKTGCGNEVVFPKLNIRKTLPIGKNVIVSLNPSQAGEISFTCGMGMMKGKILVQ